MLLDYLYFCLIIIYLMLLLQEFRRYNMSVNDFPPILSQLGTQVGKQKELTLVIPQTSKLYYIFQKEEGDLYRITENQFVNSLNSLIAYEDIKEHITSIEKNETSITVKINLENIKYQTIRVGDDYNRKNPFVFDYTIGHGYIINIEIITIRYFEEEEIMKVYEETRHLAAKFKDALISIGYTSPFYSEKYKNDKNIAHVWIRSKRISCTLTLSLYEKSVYKNYHKLEKFMKAKNLDKQYEILNTILK